MNQAIFALTIARAVGQIRKLVITKTFSPDALKPIVNNIVTAWNGAFPKETVDPVLADLIISTVDDYMIEPVV